MNQYYEVHTSNMAIKKACHYPYLCLSVFICGQYLEVPLHPVRQESQVVLVVGMPNPSCRNAYTGGMGCTRPITPLRRIYVKALDPAMAWV